MPEILSDRSAGLSSLSKSMAIMSKKHFKWQSFLCSEQGEREGEREGESQMLALTSVHLGQKAPEALIN